MQQKRCLRWTGTLEEFPPFTEVQCITISQKLQPQCRSVFGQVEWFDTNLPTLSRCRIHEFAEKLLQTCRQWFLLNPLTQGVYIWRRIPCLLCQDTAFLQNEPVDSSLFMCAPTYQFIFFQGFSQIKMFPAKCSRHSQHSRHSPGRFVGKLVPLRSTAVAHLDCLKPSWWFHDSLKLQLQ